MWISLAPLLDRVGHQGRDQLDYRRLFARALQLVEVDGAVRGLLDLEPGEHVFVGLGAAVVVLRDGLIDALVWARAIFTSYPTCLR